MFLSGGGNVQQIQTRKNVFVGGTSTLSVNKIE